MVGLLFVLYATIYMSKNMFSAAMASIVEDGFMTKSQTGAISAVFWLVYAVFQIPGGLAADKFKPAHLITIGVFGSIISNVVIYFNQRYEVILVTWAFNAFIQFGIWPGIFKIITTELAPQTRKTAMFWMVFGTTFGLSMSMLVASFVTHWLQNFIVSTVVLSVILLTWLISYRCLEKKMIITETAVPEKTETAPVERMAWKDMLKTGIWGIAIAAFLRTSVDNGIKMLTPVMLMETYEALPAALSTRLSVILTVFSFFGVLSLKLFQKRVTDNEATGVAVVMLVAIPLVAVVCLVGKIHYLLILGILCLATYLISGIGPISGSFCAGRFARYGRSGTVAGFINALAAFGNVFASYGLAVVAETNPWSVVMLICCGMLGITVLVCLIVRPVWTRFIALDE